MPLLNYKKDYSNGTQLPEKVNVVHQNDPYLYSITPTIFTSHKVIYFKFLSLCATIQKKVNFF